MTRALLMGVERIRPPRTDAVTGPCATYTVMDDDTDDVLVVAVTVTTYVLSTWRV